MLVDKITVLTMIDEGTDSWIFVQTLPNDSVFEIIIEDAATALYVKESGEAIQIKLNYDYLDCQDDILASARAQKELDRFDRDMDTALNDYYEELNNSNKHDIRLQIIIGSFMLAVIGLIYASISLLQKVN